MIQNEQERKIVEEQLRGARETVGKSGEVSALSQPEILSRQSQKND